MNDLPPLPASAAPDSGEKLLALLCHLSVFISLPFLLPLIIYLVKTDNAYVRANAAEALNFHITLIPVCIIAFLLIFIVIGFVLLPLLGLATIILSILAAIRAANGEVYRYPCCLRLFRA